MNPSLLCCPVCGKPLTFDDKSARCPKGHSFDRAARGGYIHLLRQHRRGSADPGDSAEMCQARTRFLSGGWYAPLRAQVAALAGACSPADVLDAGCGEGWYTQAVLDALPGARLAGIDLSRYALRHAGRTCPGADFAIASLFDLPLADQSVDLVLHLFAPHVRPGICAGPPPRRHPPDGHARRAPSVGHEGSALRAAVRKPHSRPGAARVFLRARSPGRGHDHADRTG